LVIFFSYLQGLLLGFSLIIAIGAQNLFVFNQGLIGKYVMIVCLFCSLSDALLILIGYSGLYLIIENNVILQNFIILIGFLWLLGYGVLKIREGMYFDQESNLDIQISHTNNRNLYKTILAISGITWLNPHVYLDTVFLIGSISNSVQSEKQFSFLLGAISSSFLFFFFLGYMGFKIGPLIKSPNLWKKINISLGIIMIMISFNLIYIYL
jgi:L-lysine exporter family protein LysE/ArgO